MCRDLNAQTNNSSATAVDLKSTEIEHWCCQLLSEEDRRQLRSADSRTCVVRWTYSNF